jgi:hypothetical protein
VSGYDRAIMLGRARGLGEHMVDVGNQHRKRA